MASDFVAQAALSLKINNPVGNNMMVELIDPTGHRNIFLGEAAGLNNTTGDDNIIMGAGNFRWNTTNGIDPGNYRKTHQVI